MAPIAHRRGRRRVVERETASSVTVCFVERRRRVSDCKLPAMSLFITELIRAANEIDKLSAHEVSRLLDRSVDTIREMREQMGAVGGQRARDVTTLLQLASARAKQLSPEDARDTLLDAAYIIRVLRMMQHGQE